MRLVTISKRWGTDASFDDVRAVLLKIQVFWDIASCRLLNSYRHFGGAKCLHIQGSEQADECRQMMGRVHFTEVLCI